MDLNLIRQQLPSVPTDEQTKARQLASTYYSSNLLSTFLNTELPVDGHYLLSEEIATSQDNAYEAFESGLTELAKSYLAQTFDQLMPKDNMSALLAILKYLPNNHSETYLNLLKALSTQLEIAKVFTSKTKIVIGIPARNEGELYQSVVSLQESYGPEFESEVSVVVFNNYALDVHMSEEAKKSAELTASRFVNVQIVDYMFQSDHNIGLVCKITMDLIIYLMNRLLDLKEDDASDYDLTQRLPVVMRYDADNKKLSKGYIQQVVADLMADEPHEVMSSPSYIHKTERSEAYPVWNYYSDVAHRTRQGLVDRGIQMPRTIGACMLIRPETYCLLGGIAMLPMGEDTEFLNRARDALTVGFLSINPVGTNGMQYTLEIDDTREIDNIVNAKAPEADWQEPVYRPIDRQGLRATNHSADQSKNGFSYLLSPELNKENTAKVLNELQASYDYEHLLPAHRNILYSGVAAELLRIAAEMRLDLQVEFYYRGEHKTYNLEGLIVFLSQTSIERTDISRLQFSA